MIRSISAVLACRIQPNHKNRDDMAKQATKWRVRRTETVPSPGTEKGKQIQRKLNGIAYDLEIVLTAEAREALKGNAAMHSHWQQLYECTDWVEEQCRPTSGNIDSEALTKVLSHIRSWLEMPRHTLWELRKRNAEQRKSIQQEISLCHSPLDIQTCAFTQHALRELLAQTTTWTGTIKTRAPTGLLGRAGQEHLRTMASDITANPACWPFHLAGDSGQSLFNHRAWLSWRFLALIELPELTVPELPCLSKDLHALIEATRAKAQTDEFLSGSTVG